MWLSSKPLNDVKRGRGRPRKKPILEISATPKIEDPQGTKMACSSQKAPLISNEHLLEESRRLGLSVANVKKMAKLEKQEKRAEKWELAKLERRTQRFGKSGKGGEKANLE